MGFGGLSIATSGIRAAQVNLAITGHNISNSEIPGYSRQRIVQTTSFTRTAGLNRAGQPIIKGMGTDWNAVHQIRNEFLDISYRQNVGRLQFYSTVVQAGLVVESLLGELHGAYNFQSVLNDMWTRIQELSTNPGGIDTRQLFLATANSFLNKAQSVSQGLFDYQLNLDQQVRAMVDEINFTAREINRLNDHIRAEEAGGDNANDARDERNRLVDRMAEMIPIETFIAPDGDIVIISQGHTIVSQGFVNNLGLRYISNQFSFVEPVFTNSREILSAGTPPHEFVAWTNYFRPINNANGNDSGQLNALLMARGTTPAHHMTDQIPPPMQELATLIAGLGGSIDNTTSPPTIVPGLSLAAAETARDTTEGLLTTAQGNLDTMQGLLDTAQAALVIAQRNLDDDPTSAILLGLRNDALAARDLALTNRNTARDARDVARDNFTQAQINIQNVIRRDLLLDDDYMAAETHNWNAKQWSVNHGKIPRVQQNLDRIVHSVVSMINDALTGNLRMTDANGNQVPIPGMESPLDMQGNTGIPLFIRRTDMVDDRGYITWPFQGVNAVNPNNVNSVLTINNIQINPQFLELNGHDFLALSPSGAADDNTLLLALQTIWLSNNSPYAVNIGGRYFNVQDAYIRFTGDIATQISEANNFVAAQTIKVQQADHMRLAVKGVSMDEELNAMLRFQFAFQAASRVFNMIDGMIDQVVNRTGRVGL